MKPLIPASSSLRRLSIRARMVLAMLAVAALLIPVVILSVFYIRSLNTVTSRIVNQGIELVQTGNRIPLEFARARRHYENFVRTRDSAEYWQAQAALSRIGGLVARSRLLEPALAPFLDSIARCLESFRQTAGLEFTRPATDTVTPPGQSSNGAILILEPSLPSALAAPLETRIRQLNAAIVEQSDSTLALASRIIALHQLRGQQLSAWGQRNIVTALLITVAVLIWLVIILPQQIVLPVKRIANALRRAEQGDLTTRINVPTKDEIGSLARQLNRLFARLREFDNRKTERIQLLERRFRLLAGDISEGVLVVDRTPKLLYANPPMEPLLGCRASDATGHNLSEFPRLAALAQSLEETLAGASGHQECEILPGLPFSAICIEALRDASGSISGALIVITNPTAPDSDKTDTTPEEQTDNPA